MTLASLKSLALVTSENNKRKDWPLSSQETWAKYQAHLSPDRVLSLIACIEAADAMREAHSACWPNNPFEQQRQWNSRQAYDAARAALEDK